MLQDPLRQDPRVATDDDLNAIVQSGSVSRGLGRALVYEEAQITDRVLGGIQSDTERAFDDDRARMFGEQYRNELSAAEATAEFGVQGYLTFDGPVNRNRAEEMHRQARLRRYREETAARGGLSALDTIGASIVGSIADPVLIPTWFIGGGGAMVRSLRIAPGATRGAQIARGAAVGVIDGLAGGAAAETINAGARRGAGEDYDFSDSARNILFGGAFGATIGGATGGIAPVRRPRGPLADTITRAAEEAGENADTLLRIAQLESGLNPRARNPRSSAAGLFQFIDGTWAQFGGGDRMDPTLSARNAARLTAQNRSALQQGLNRAPEEWELYLAHQQGAGGAVALRRNPDAPAVEVLRSIGNRNPLDSIRLNGGRADMTAGEFSELWRRKFAALGGGEAPPMPDQPPVRSQGLTDNERVGAFAEALEAAAEDAPLDLGPLLARGGLDALDEASAVPSIRGQWLEADVAVTRTGAEVPVRFAVVELDDLRTSHTDDLTADPTYPQALQPRDRSRPGSVAENFELERDLNPKLLMRDKAASAGAPIVSPDGLVESGNGRVIALRRSARTATGAWARYLPELKAQGISVEGFRKPVLVRVRSEALTGQQRADLAAGLNRSQTEAYSPIEQALADARRLDAETVRLIESDDPFAASNRPFQRAFQERVAPGDKGALTDADGQMNPAGRERVRAALVQAAYGDRQLTAALFDTADETLLAVGNALADAAPAWARMTAEAPRHVNMTENLVAAVHLLRHARQSREATDKVLARLLASEGLLDGAAVSVETEAFLRLMFRDVELTQARGAERLGWALKTYAKAAGEVADGPNLFGEIDNAQTIVARIRERLGAAEGTGQSGLAYAGGSEPGWTTREAAPAVLDLRPAEPVSDGPGGGGQRPGDGGEVARPGRRDGAASVGTQRLDPAAEAEASAIAVTDVRAELAQLESQAAAANAVVETRGQGVQYHGARGPITSLQEGYSNDANIYGGFETFYTTDAADIATGYFRKQPDAVLYAAREVEPVRFFDMEEGLPVAEWEKRLGLDDDFMGLALDEASIEHGPTPNLRQIMDEARAQSRGEGLSRSDVQEYFDGITDTLQREGFGGMRHIGGLLTQRAPHEVKIYFRPHEQIELQAVPVPRQGVPADLASQIADATQRLRQAEVRSAAAADRVEAQKAAAAADAGREARVAALIANDPEMKALVEDTEALALAGGQDLPAFERSTEPSTVAEAIRAAAFCLTTEFDV